MPLWKKKNEDAIKAIALESDLSPDSYHCCPDCLAPGIKQINPTNAVYFGMRQYYCAKCGYTGMVYVDAGPTGDHEDDLELELLEVQDPEFIKSIRPTAELATESLEEKWLPDQASNENNLMSWCAFCAEVQTICKVCPCPKEICSDHGKGGLIGQLNVKYPPETLLKDVDPEIYQNIIAAFRSLCKK